MKTKSAALVLLLAACSLVHAQNTTFTYQGRVLTNGVGFTGTGQFEFALVSSVNTNQTATATAAVQATYPGTGSVIAITLISGGSGYVTAPAVTLVGGGGTGAAATSHIGGDLTSPSSVSSITIDNPGTNYSAAPTVIIAPPPASATYTTYWNNDGSAVAVNGTGVIVTGLQQPNSAVRLGVTNGLFTVILGNTQLTNMTGIPASLLNTQPGLQLAVWFNDGVHGIAPISPLQPLTPAPYAAYAGSASNLLGTVPVSALPAAVVTNNQGGLALSGTFTGDGHNLGNLDASQLTGVLPQGVLGTVPLAALPPGVVTNTQVNVALKGTFAGNGNGLTNLDASQVTGVLPQTAFPGFSFPIFATVNGGQSNVASGIYSVVSGGYQNIANNDYAVVGGGYFNHASDQITTVGGGSFNSASAEAATVSGGENNIASGIGAIVGGGGFDGVSQSGGNTASGAAAVVAGGVGNQATGDYAAIPGGFHNIAKGTGSFAAGVGAQANDNYSFIWSDGSRTAVSQGANSFSVLATGGFYIFSGPFPDGVKLAPNGTSWGTLSDENTKKNFAPVNAEEVLTKLASVPVETWNYKWESETNAPNIGPMAQAFKAAFYPGRDNKVITTLEFDGVELAAIQGLNHKLAEKDVQIEELKARLEKLERLINSEAKETK